MCSVHFVDGCLTEDQRYPTLHLVKHEVLDKGRRKIKLHYVDPPQLERSLELNVPSSVPHPHVGDEPSENHCAPPTNDDTTETFPATNRLGPGIITYEWAFRGNKEALVSPGCITCGCTCKSIRKADKAIQAQLERDKDHTYYTNVEVQLDRKYC